MSYAFDPELLPLVEMLAPGDFSDVAAARAGLAALIAPMNAHVDTSGLTIEDHRVPGPDGAPPVPVRVYAPVGDAPAGGRPALLDIHGGGFVVGDIEMEHGFAAAVARGARRGGRGRRVPPRTRAPVPRRTRGLLRGAGRGCTRRPPTLGVDPERIAVGGQSAGGGLSAATALLARDRGGPPLCFQFLGIPELDHRLETTSMRTFVDTPMWHRGNAELSWQLLPRPGSRARSRRTRRRRSRPTSRGLPPAYVTTMEFDPLRDEGILYALRLMEAGVSVELHAYPGTFHGSAVVPTAAVSRRASQELLVALARGLGVAR